MYIPHKASSDSTKFYTEELINIPLIIIILCMLNEVHRTPLARQLYQIVTLLV
jgi:hypothetical protein